MHPESLLARLRRRHGVSEAFAQRFLPLVERAVRASPDVRERILELVERSFARRAGREVRTSPADRILLHQVARILHRWEPAPWLKGWGK